MSLFRSSLVIVLVAVTSALSLAAIAQDAPLVARLGPGNAVELLDADGTSWRRIYASPTAWRLSGLTVGPSGRLGVLEWKKGVVEGNEYTVPPEPELILLDIDGTIAGRVGVGIQKYAWCGPNKIAAIIGTYHEEGDIGFRPSGVVLIDLAAGPDQRVLKLSAVEHPIDLKYVAADNALYMIGGTPKPRPSVMKYSLADGTLVSTPVIQPNFSPTGRYYLVYWRDLESPRGSDTVSIIDARTQTAIDAPQIKAFGRIVRWAFDSGDYVLVEKRVLRATTLPDSSKRRGKVITTPGKPASREYALFDVPSGTKQATFRAALVEAVTSGSAAVLRKDGKVEVLRGP